jgi:hypothetical protein
VTALSLPAPTQQAPSQRFTANVPLAAIEDANAFVGYEADREPLISKAGRPAFLRAEIGGGHGETSIVYREPLWWPAGKIAARYLGPYLAERARSPSGSRYEPSRLLL